MPEEQRVGAVQEAGADSADEFDDEGKKKKRVETKKGKLKVPITKTGKGTGLKV